MFQLSQAGASRFELIDQSLLFPAAGHQGFSQFQQPAAQRLGLIAVVAGAKAQTTAALGEAAAGHGAAFFQQFPFQGHGSVAAEVLTSGVEIAEDLGVSEDVGKHLAVNRLETHEINGTANQTSTGGSLRPAPSGHGGTTTTTTGSADFVEGKEGQATSTAALEQLDGFGGDAVVVHHHLAKASTGSHFQGQAMAFFHLAKLGDGSMDAVEPCLQQQPQGTGSAALLQRFPPAFQLGDVAFKPALLLLKT